ncbi:hypothetical protein FKM82_011786 [Ascaphus truei]
MEALDVDVSAAAQFPEVCGSCRVGRAMEAPRTEYSEAAAAPRDLPGEDGEEERFHDCNEAASPSVTESGSRRGPAREASAAGEAEACAEGPRGKGEAPAEQTGTVLDSTTGGPGEGSGDGSGDAACGSREGSEASGDECGAAAGEEEEPDEEALLELEKELSEEERERRKEQGTCLKEEGNKLFKKGDYVDAEAVYSQALRTCPAFYQKDRSILFSNRAAARIKQDKNEFALKDCGKAIALNPNYVRALLRRAELYEKTDKLDEALADYKSVLEKDASSYQAREACMRLPKQIEERNEKLKEEMISKLKDLGNLVLRPFGLSTENFKVNQDSTSGSYSVNFVQNPNNNR